jgi:regulator of sigma E protease
MSILITLLVFAGTILVLVGAHEIGHFVAAKLTGVRVLEFAIGFGPRLLSRRSRGTVYSLRAIPIGGFVRMAGDVGAREEEDVPANEMLVNKKPLVRIVISLAGPIANVAITLVVTLAVSLGYGIPALQIIDVIPGMPAENAFQVGDALLRIEGRPVPSPSAITRAIASSEGGSLDIELLRAGEPVSVSLTPVFDTETERYVLGFYHGIVAHTRRLIDVAPTAVLFQAGVRVEDEIVAVNGTPVANATALIIALDNALPGEELHLTVRRADEERSFAVDARDHDLLSLLIGVTFESTDLLYHRFGALPDLQSGWSQFVGYFRLFGEVIGGVVRGRIAPGEAFRGPVGIAQMLGESVERGSMDFLVVFSLFSLSLGLMNLLPFPALDGSRIAFALYELIRRKPFPPQREGLIHAIGFLLLLGLFVLVTYKDLVALFR